MKGYRLIRIAALVAICPAVVGLAWGWFGVHPPRPPRASRERPSQYGIAYQDITLSTADGLVLSAWYTEPGNGAVILVGHGYGSSRAVEMHALFARHGYGVLSWDFRAHGQSDGTLCTIGHFEALDVEAALDFALAQPTVHWIGIWGGSMGGIAAVRAASERPEIEAVIIDSVPTTFAEVAHIAVQPAILRTFASHVARQETGIDLDSIRPIDEIEQIAPRPLFVIQGLSDQLIPIDSAQRLCNAVGDQCTLWIEPEVRHLEMYHSRPAEYEDRIIEFLNAAMEKAAVKD